MGVVEERVHVCEEGVPDFHGAAGGFGDGGPAVGFLAYGGFDVVVAVEGAV